MGSPERKIVAKLAFVIERKLLVYNEMWCQEGHWAVVEDILTSIEGQEEREELVQRKDADGNCPTLLATMAGGAENAGKLREAFERGGTFDVLDEPNKQGECALHYAARYN